MAHRLNALLLLSSLLSSGSVLAATTASDISTWPSRRIPFLIEAEVPAKVQKTVRAAIKRINELQIVNLTETAESDDFSESLLLFTYKKGRCSSTLGGGDGSSTLVRVSEDCQFGNTLHEILHGLGMVHEQVNPRMNPKVNMDRVKGVAEDQHEMLTAEALTAHDPNSIMHYHSFDDSICDDPEGGKWKELPKSRLPHASCRKKNWRDLSAEKNSGVDCRKECAIFLGPHGEAYGRQRADLSPLDIEGLRLLYQNAN